MNLKYKQIIGVFENLKVLKQDGIWFSGVKNKGEYKEWYDNGQIRIHCFYIGKDKYKGEFK